MDVTVDELAGIVDLFGGLTRTELERALSEAAFREDGGSVDEAALEDTLEDALTSFALIRYEGSDVLDGDADDTALFVAGPTAFPSVPTAAEDLPHILDIEPRSRRLDRDVLGDQAHDRFARDAANAIDADDDDRIDDLLDVSYDLEAWAPVDLTPERERLDAALEAE
ncbi:hypothetical protein OB955_20710 [Halobacteria archaeon AArc-m2/3/4]|uniref:Uncharacterized protein n=1 Tax=Natronoglomus mannanivorans TaxID=2979990 RepID=A0AAP2YZR1_9EURY|nr:hypothetical protein [Halobacteria archaeon AArc-xg1-1]MCU4975125.1 hypothetical protein [Halobacteria archaeon AArc-m2/3/4]